MGFEFKENIHKSDVRQIILLSCLLKGVINDYKLICSLCVLFFQNLFQKIIGLGHKHTMAFYDFKIALLNMGV